jgi:phage shock protein A
MKAEQAIDLSNPNTFSRKHPPGVEVFEAQRERCLGATSAGAVATSDPQHLPKQSKAAGVVLPTLKSDQTSAVGFPEDSHPVCNAQDLAMLAAEIAQERQRHEEEVRQLKHANTILESQAMKTAKQVQAMRQRMEMRVTEHSRTSFDLQREKERVQVNL